MTDPTTLSKENQEYLCNWLKKHEGGEFEKAVNDANRKEAEKEFEDIK